MIVLVTSGCRLKSWTRSKRILDGYLPRVGKRVWSGRITSEGLDELTSELKAASSKNTSVSVFKIDSTRRVSLLCVIGSKRLVRKDGRAAAHEHTRGKLNFDRAGRAWRHRALLVHLSELAGLIHDWGKSTRSFQQKLKRFEIRKDPVRHELVSYWLFRRVIDLMPESGFESPSDLAHCIRQVSETFPTGLTEPAVFARKSGFDAALWAVLNHHRQCRSINSSLQVEEVMCSGECVGKETLSTELMGESALIEKIWSCLGRCIAESARTEFGEGLFLLLRAILVVADQSVSASGEKISSTVDGLVANSFRDQKRIKQSLVDHLTWVGAESRSFARVIMAPGRALKAIPVTETPASFYESSEGRFSWQNEAIEALQSVDPEAGFFGVVLAETGTGKTVACAKIMRALSPYGMRFTKAIGLRSITAQAAKSYREDLGLSIEQSALLLGGSPLNGPRQPGTENDLLDEDLWVDGGDAPHLTGAIADLAASSPKVRTLLATPIVLCTIDFLIKLADGERSNFSAAACRAMSSDLILDEIDDYDEMDFAYVQRLVYWMGLFKRKVLISSATVPVQACEALYAAYREGLEQRCLISSEPVKSHFFVTGNQEGMSRLETGSDSSWLKAHLEVVLDRHTHRLPLHEIFESGDSEASLLEQMYRNVGVLHERSHHLVNGIRYSAQLIRVAKIKSAVQVAIDFDRRIDPPGVQTLIVCYHSRLIGDCRERIESFLESALNRKHSSSAAFEDPEFLSAIEPDTREVRLVVIATPICEVGRDVDFDGIQMELSSLRSVIQCAGRLYRHRGTPPDGLLMIADKSFALLSGAKHIYSKPGPEGAFFGQIISVGQEKLASLIIGHGKIAPAHRMIGGEGAPMSCAEARKLNLVLDHSRKIPDTKISSNFKKRRNEVPSESITEVIEGFPPWRDGSPSINGIIRDHEFRFSIKGESQVVQFEAGFEIKKCFLNNHSDGYSSNYQKMTISRHVVEAPARYRLSRSLGLYDRESMLARNVFADIA